MSRRSREELRTLMIDAGCELVNRRGLAFDPPSLTYANVFQHLETTKDIHLHRSQVHGRIWESQDHYRTEVIIRTIQHVLPSANEVDAFVARLTLDTNIDTRRLIEGWVAGSRGLGNDSADDYLGFDILVAAQALTHKDSASSSRITDAATANLGERMLNNERRFDSVTSDLGLEFAADLGLDQDDAVKLLARNASALPEGLSLMESLGGTTPDSFDIIGDDGTPETIDATNLGLLTFIGQLFGIDR